MHNILERCLFHHARIHVHHGKAKMWNRSGRRPTGVDELTAARLEDPEAVVWRGDQSLETKVQGFKVLGAPIGLILWRSSFWPRSRGSMRCCLTDTRHDRLPKCVVGASVLCSSSSKFLVENGPPRDGCTVCRKSRCQHVGVSGMVEYTVIQKRFHPRHFHPKIVSSNEFLIQ